VADPRALAALTQVDWIFLAADTNTARDVTNAVIQRYLVPGIRSDSPSQSQRTARSARSTSRSARRCPGSPASGASS